MNSQRCTSWNVGMKLHAFEVGMLNTEDRRQFEQHLLECSYCFEQAKRHSQAMMILSRDREVQERFISDSQDETETTPPEGPTEQSQSRRTKSYVWLALAASIVLVSVIGYQTLNDAPGNEPVAQIVKFSQTRSSGGATVFIDSTPTIVFEVPLVQPVEGEQLAASIVSVDDTAYTWPVLLERRTPHLGQAEWELDTQALGLYLMHVTVRVSDSVFHRAEYTFRVK